MPKSAPCGLRIAEAAKVEIGDVECANGLSRMTARATTSAFARLRLCVSANWDLVPAFP